MIEREERALSSVFQSYTIHIGGIYISVQTRYKKLLLANT